MKKAGFLILVLICLAAIHGSAQTTLTAGYFNCVTGCGAAYSLDKYSGSTPILAIVAGYYQPGDAGGGQYIPSTACPDAPSALGAFTAGNSTITAFNSGGPSVLVGSIINAPGFVPAGTEIAAVQGSKITMTEPATQTTPPLSTTSFTITGSNGGTVIGVTVGSSPACFYKTDYRGDPHEFGAYGDGKAHGGNGDTVAMQNWLGAYGMVTNPLATNAPTNFGPYIATIPATYLVTQPLVCPQYANLQGPANIAVGTPSNGGVSSSPVVNIVAAATNQQGQLGLTNTLGLPALMTANAYCRISGISLDAGANGSQIFPNLTGSVSGPTATLLASVPTGVVPGMPLNDAGGGNCIPKGAAITAISGANNNTLTISLPATKLCGSQGSGDSITITGFYAVDVVGTHVGIDGHSLIKNGFQNVHCGDIQVDGLQIKDAQFLNSWDTGVNIPSHCDDARVIDDLIAESGQALALPNPPAGITGAGIYFGGEDFSVESGIVEQSLGPNIILSNARGATVNGMVIAGGSSPAVYGMEIVNSSQISVCANHFQGNGGDTTGTSQVLLSGILDGVNFCGNNYVAGSYSNDANVYPWYDFDVSSPLPTLTNVHIYDTPEQPAVAMFSPAAQPLLQPLLVPQFTQNLISGLTLSNDATNPNTVIDVAAGSAADSTNSTLMTLPPTAPSTPSCTVNFHQHGPGGLDYGSFSAGTYFIYLIAAVGANSTQSPSCMASLSSVAPSFQNNQFSGTGYSVTATAGTQSSNAQAANVLLNVNPLSGVAVGDAVLSDGQNIDSNTTISAFSANQQLLTAEQITGYWSSGATTITLSAQAPTDLYDGMVVQDTKQGCLRAGTYIESISSNVLTISTGTTCAESQANPALLSVSGASQLVLNKSAISTTLATIQISTGYYRMIGAVTAVNPNNPNLVPFTQDGDTFYLASPSADVTGLSLGSTAATMQLGSVPSGISVKAFGRCVGGSSTPTLHRVIVYSPGQTVLPPAQAFPTAPGFDVSSLTPSTVFPFSAWTDTAQSLRAISDSSTSGTSIQCMTDGWIWNPVQPQSVSAGAALRRTRRAAAHRK